MAFLALSAKNMHKRGLLKVGNRYHRNKSEKIDKKNTLKTDKVPHSQRHIPRSSLLSSRAHEYTS